MFDGTMRRLYVKLANYALNLDSNIHKSLSSHKGKTIRIKTTEPYNLFYITINERNISVSSEFEGDEQVRCRMAFNTLANAVFGLETNPKDIRIEGDTELICSIMQTFSSPSIWGIFKGLLTTFVPDLTSADDLIRLLLGKEPEWAKKFDCLPELQRETIKTLDKICEKQDKELFNQKEISEQLERIKLQNKFTLLILTFMSGWYIIQSLGIHIIK